MPTSALVLVVDDEPLLAQLLEDTLAEAGFEVATTSTAKGAFEALGERGELIRALVTDVNLGPSGSGWEVARRGRELNPSLPVVYVTGDSEHEWPSQGVPDSVIVPKPFAPAQIVTAVSMLMNAVGGHKLTS